MESKAQRLRERKTGKNKTLSHGYISELIVTAVKTTCPLGMMDVSPSM